MGWGASFVATGSREMEQRAIPDESCSFKDGLPAALHTHGSNSVEKIMQGSDGALLDLCPWDDKMSGIQCTCGG